MTLDYKMKALVIGDIILDINLYSDTNRTAPEADIPVYNIIQTEYILGGASNIVNNLNNLDCAVEIISVIGDDIAGKNIQSLFEKNKINNKLFIDSSRKTTQKTRLFHNDKLITRYDIEDTHYLNKEFETSIIDYIKDLKDIDIILFSDYGKGVLTKTICETIIKLANNEGILTFVDPKTLDALKFKNCTCFKCNLTEGRLITKKTNISEIITNIKKIFNCEYVVLTNGKDGLYLNSIDNHVFHKKKINAIDVTGCGDIILTILAYLHNKNKNLLHNCEIANYIAGKCASKIGNYLITPGDINEYVDKVVYDNEEDKIKYISRMSNQIVFTNGCFDLIHSAHIRLLQFSKKQGDILVVGLNADESIKRIKGESRPVNNVKERCELLKNLDFIDYIIIFNDDTPYKILSILKPNIIVKGGDYVKDTIVGKEYANEILIYNYIDGISSTKTIHKITNAYYAD